MRAALSEAQAADDAGEVPVGAVVVCNGTVIGTGRNAPIGLHDPSAHAEMLALRAAALYLGNYRLDDCELYVTLEPCIMCAGAMLHARLKRVVFGASDTKTGAAGSVLDVFAMRQLNHHTQLQGGVMAQTCTELLQHFFQRQRQEQQLEKLQEGRALREDALRTPESCFSKLPEIAALSCYVSDLPSLVGLRLHYLDAGPTDAAETCLCLHGSGDWSFAWRSFVALAGHRGQRAICPDLIGFGKSDKPKKAAVHSLPWHAQILAELIERLDLHHIILIVADAQSPLARQLLAVAPDRISSIVCTEADPLDQQALEAPFPDAGHRAALRAFSSMKLASALTGAAAYNT